MMDVTRTAYGIWSGGRFMHFGEPLPEERFIQAVQGAYQKGVRTFLTADVYGSGQADQMLGRALQGVARDTYCLVGAVGHDFYTGKREGSKGFPRFTDPALRQESDYGSYLRMAAERAAERCRTNYFDLLLLHNPDSIGYTSDAVWTGMAALKEARLAHRLGIAPGPANGFTLDLIHCFAKFEHVIDWAMVILNPLEPWPGKLSLAPAEKHNVKLITRVVDYGGLFHDDVKPGHQFGPQDHRTFRPAGWVEAGNKKLDALRPIADAHGLTLLQLACLWNLAQPAVHSVVPTLIQEVGPDAKPFEHKLDELAALPNVQLSPGELLQIEEIGDNTGCMSLKGGNPQHEGDPLPDRWPLSPELRTAAQRWGIEPEKDLVPTH